MTADLFLEPEFSIGERVYYVLPKSRSSGRTETLYLEVTVINITSNRIVVRQVRGNRSPRILMRHKLTRTVPENAWVK